MSYKISPSTMKAFYEDGSCRKYWYFKNIEKSIERDPPSEAMVKGIVFETLALGENVAGSELPSHDFLYTKNGGKTTSLLRIEEQAAKFKRITDPSSDEFIGFSVVGSQFHIENDKWKGVIDINGVDLFERTVISDLKFTSDVNATYGDYAWGREPSVINWDQIAMYKVMWRDNFPEEKEPKTNVLVFDDSPRLGSKSFDIKLSNSYIDNVFEKADTALNFIDRAKSSDSFIEAKVSPSEKNCSKCPLECDFRYKKPSIENVKVYV